MSSMFIFPGQGAQAIGMGADLAAAFPACRDLFDRAAGVLGFDLLKLCTEGPMEELTRSSNTQPAIFVVSAAAQLALELIRARAGAEPVVPAGAAGLSSGEWAALYAAGVVGFEDAIRILQVRGAVMQEACEATPGGMLTVIGLPPERVEVLAKETGLEVANYNSPVQTVLSGHAHLLADAEALAKAAGAKRALKLTVAGAFHSSLMKPAAEKLEAFLKEVFFAEPAIPVWSNVTAKPHTTPEEIRRLMVEQVYSPVRWSASFENMWASGMTAAYELGPGTVLAGLAKRIAPEVSVANIFDLAGAEAAATIPV